MNDQELPTCTVRVSAVTGELCGRPAVRVFTSRINGRQLAECADHDAGPVSRTMGLIPTLQVGDRVAFRYTGLDRTGAITRVGRTRCTVQFELRNGTTKLLDLPITSVDAID